MKHLLAGDVGGTNTRLALHAEGDRRQVFAAAYRSFEDASFEQVARRFLGEAADAMGGPVEVARACVGVAGPVEGNACRATNVPWTIDGGQLGDRLGIGAFRIINDFVAMARAVPELEEGDVRPIGGGQRVPRAPIAVLGPGTGLGNAFLIWSPGENRYRVVASEGGHVDLAARTETEAVLVRHLAQRYGRATNERALSGPGIVDAFSCLADEDEWRGRVTPELQASLATADDGAAVISAAGVSGADPVCHAVMTTFAGLLGAVAGNLALLVLARGGVFIGGGIAPRIVDFLEREGTRAAFEAKGRYGELMRSIPLSVITREHPGVLGAAACAAEL